MPRRNWTRDELIVSFNLYCKLRFGQLHRRNPQIMQLATMLGRTPSAVSMKLCNFASFDPSHQKRGISGLSNSSQADAAVWGEFNDNWTELAAESERAFRELRGENLLSLTESQPTVSEPMEELKERQRSETETQRLLKVRLGQAFFRSTVLASYNYRCCICELPCQSLLVASHIVPWAVRPEVRMNPKNGLSLCALHDRAFDQGLISLDSSYLVMLGTHLEQIPHMVIEEMFVRFRGSPIHLPEKFAPNTEYLDYHRTQVFQV